MSILGKRDETKEHRYYQEQLSAYLDGELTAREQRLMEEHLKACAGCRWELATLRQTVRWMAELPTVPVPRAFTIPASAVETAPARRRWLPFGGERPRFVPALQAATVLVAFLLVFAAAGDVMLTGWPWSGAAGEPMMLQEAAPAAWPTESRAWQAGDAEEQPAGGSEGGAVASAPPNGVDEATTVAMEVPAEEAVEAPAPAPGEIASEAELDASRGMTPTTTSPAAEIDLAPTAVVLPTPTALPTVHPRTTKALSPPTAVVQVVEPAAPPDVAEGTALGLDPGEQEGALFWLRLIEYVLGVALLLLVTMVLVLRVWRRRTR